MGTDREQVCAALPESVPSVADLVETRGPSVPNVVDGTVIGGPGEVHP